MISKDTVTIFVDTATAHLKSKGWFGQGIKDGHKASVREAVEKAFAEIGVKVEGKEE